jgi:hypothetical protein
MIKIMAHGGCQEERAYRRLLNDDILHVKVLELEVLRIRIRLGVLQEAHEEADGLLRPAT